MKPMFLLSNNSNRNCLQSITNLAKPGMGVDEGYMIVKNEMNQLLLWLIEEVEGDIYENWHCWFF